MGMRAIVRNHYLLARKNPKTGYQETVVYSGSLRQKPKGWTLVKPL